MVSNPNGFGYDLFLQVKFSMREVLNDSKIAWLNYEKITSLKETNLGMPLTCHNLQKRCADVLTIQPASMFINSSW